MDNIVKAKIEREISRIETALTYSKPLRDLCRVKEPDYIEVMAMTQELQAFYSGIESIVTLIFKSINEVLPSGHKWHKALLNMAFGQNSKNLKIFRDDLRGIMDLYLGFRHIARHVYGIELKWMDGMEFLVLNLEETWGTIKTDFEIFMKNNIAG